MDSLIGVLWFRFPHKIRVVFNLMLSNMSASPAPTVWLQKSLRLPARTRGCHLVTEEIIREFSEILTIEIGLLHLFLQHTSASLSINENADPDVRADMEKVLNRIVPEDQPLIHTIEGPDDMPAHVKSSLFGCSLLVPIARGRMALGTWQGIYLCEHRNHATPRSLVLTLQGQQRLLT